jgi:hypothetical protein
MSRDSFSKRYGYTGQSIEISIWEDAPESLRFAVLETASALGLTPKALRTVVSRTLLIPPDQNNWSDSNVWDEVQSLVYGCEWFKVYDIIEAIHAALLKKEGQDYGVTAEVYGRGESTEFANAINSVLIERGIGWQIQDGKVVTRGSDTFEKTVQNVVSELKDAGRPTAATRIQEALNDLSRRPDPDPAGAISHAIAALECVAGDITGDSDATLGDFLKHHPNLFGGLKKSIEGIWGYASNEGARHGKEGVEPNRDEAELVVSIAAAVVTYLNRKNTK